MQTLPPGPLGHLSAGEFIHNHHPAVHDDVLLVPDKKLARHQSLTDEFLPPGFPPPQPLKILAQASESIFPMPREFDLTVAIDNPKISVGHKPFGDPPGGRDRRLQVGILPWLRDDERGDSLIDEHTVCLVHDGGMQTSKCEPIISRRIPGPQQLAQKAACRVA